MGLLSNQIAGLLRRKMNWKITFTPGTKVKRFLESTKDPEEGSPPGIYEIPCEPPCEGRYIGQSLDWRSRIGQHGQSLKNHSYDTSAVCRHVMKNKFNHRIDWKNSRLICQERNSHLRKVKEGLFIQQSKQKIKLMNDDDGYVLSDQWLPIVPILEKQTLELYGDEKKITTTFNRYNLRSSTKPPLLTYLR